MTPQEANQVAASAIQFAASQAKMAIQAVAEEYRRPCVVFKPRLYPDGNIWCALLGDNLATGVAGFGTTPADAMWDFDRAWVSRLDQAPEDR